MFDVLLVLNATYVLRRVRKTSSGSVRVCAGAYAECVKEGKSNRMRIVKLKSVVRTKQSSVIWCRKYWLCNNYVVVHCSAGLVNRSGRRASAKCFSKVVRSIPDGEVLVKRSSGSGAWVWQ